MTHNTTDDFLVTWLADQGIPLTRGVYLAIAFPEGEPDPWTAEDEMMLPKELQGGEEEAAAVELAGMPQGLKILGATLAQWAATFAAADEHRIEMAIRSGLLSGLENVEVARQVVGSQRLLGVDGVTEITRRQIAQLAGVTLKRNPKSA